MIDSCASDLSIMSTTFTYPSFTMKDVISSANPLLPQTYLLIFTLVKECFGIGGKKPTFALFEAELQNFYSASTKLAQQGLQTRISYFHAYTKTTRLLDVMVQDRVIAISSVQAQ